LFLIILCSFVYFRKKPECRKFMYGLPRFFPQMEALFQNTAVDGSTSCIPRLSNFDAPEDEDDEVET
jgi:hypothetical protein